jgi:hypothetical protein
MRIACLSALLAVAAALGPAAPGLAQPPGEVWLSCSTTSFNGQPFDTSGGPINHLLRLAGGAVFRIDDNGREIRADGGGTLSTAEIRGVFRAATGPDGHTEYRIRINRFDGTMVYNYVTIRNGVTAEGGTFGGNCERQASPRF